MVASSRRASRVSNKTKLLVYRGSDKVDQALAETIVWNADAASDNANKHQHVGAKGVETGELLEHHLQAALSSASLLHSRDATKPSSPNSRASSTKPEPAPVSEGAPAAAALAYHIPTPDATGLVDNINYAKLYHSHKWVEPTNYIRFSDTVEEASCGTGGLGYCMDDQDVTWLTAFNAKAEGGSASAPNGSAPTSPVQGRSARKGKEKEKAEAPAPLFISEDTFEYIMGVLEKHTEDTVPMLHTNLALMPVFSQVEPLFSSPLAASFFPSNEVPKSLPECRTLARMARSVYPHWKSRRERRQGKLIIPGLNFDETNDGDPYVCFRRRDVRTARKTRRTDNFSVEQFQKLQYELRRAHDLATLVLRRETEKKAMYSAEKDVWEAKWKLFETKRRWPSLGISREEEEIITGRQSGAAAAAAAALQAAAPLTTSNNNNVSRKRQVSDKEKEERERRDRTVEPSRTTERQATGRSMAPDAIKERLQILRAKLDEELARHKAADSHWDDYTDASYQPLPTSPANHAFRPLGILDPHYREDDDDNDDDDRRIAQPMAFRLRRGRGGRVLLDRRLPVRVPRRGPMPTSADKLSSWLFPDDVASRPSRRRPRSIDESDGSDDESRDPKRARLNEVTRYDASRGGALGVGMGLAYDDDRIVLDDYDTKYISHRVTLLHEEDLAKLRPDPAPLAQAMLDLSAPVDLPPPPKFIKPAPSTQLAQYQQQMIQQQQMENLQRFQMLAQQQAMEQQARMQQQQQQQQQQQAQAQQQQQQAFAAAQAQAAQQAQAQPQQSQSQPSAQPQQAPPATPQAQQTSQPTGTPNGTTQMLPPNGVATPQNGRPQPIKRPSSAASQPAAVNSPSPAVALTPQQQQQQQQLMAAAAAAAAAGAGGSPQIVNGAIIMPNGKPFVPGAGGVPGIPTPAGALDPQIQQQRLATARLVAAQQQAAQAQQQAAQAAQSAEAGLENFTPEQRRELLQLAQQHGFGNNVQAYITLKRSMTMKQQLALQQAQAVAAGQVPVPLPMPVPGTPVANGTPQPGFPSPAMTPSQLQLKLPAHAAARLAGTTPTPPHAQAQRS